jgi:hypothetical protein
METIYKFFENNSYYVVLLISLLIWIGIYGYITSLSKKVTKLEKSLNNYHNE